MMNKTKTSEDVASQRMIMITPLLEDGLDHAQIVELKKKIADDNNISYRTVGRYLAAYEEDGFFGLRPKTSYKRSSSNLPDDFPQILEQAIILRKECPTRSVKDIIRILELEGLIKSGSIHRSTLQRHLQSSGFGANQVKIYSQKGVASKRFAKPHRMMLLQGDIKYGPHLPIGKDGTMKQVYLSVFIDDATRYIVSAKFYDNQQVDIIEDSLRSAVTHYGKPDKIYVDNGKQYRSNWLRKACNHLGIRLLFAKPYHPEGKGKVESFNRRIDAFLSEVALDAPKTLEELNAALKVWIDGYYHKNRHSALDNMSPETAFKTDKRALKFVDANALIEAFLHTETRKVDKTGCISFSGKKYDVGMQLIGRNVEVYFDPTWTDIVEIRHPDFKPFKAKAQMIGANCGVKSELPRKLEPVTANGSRLLKALNQDNITNRTNKETAISFRDLGGIQHV